eukprot:Sro84_g044730.1 ataxin 10 (347) ;mRNA; r:39054-40094
MSTLCRQLVPVGQIKALIHDNTQNNDDKDAHDTGGLGDSATEWITLLLTKCCKLGHFSKLFSSLAGQNKLPADIAIFPEHMVLLQCIHSELDAPGSKEIVLGGEAGVEEVIATHVFLSELCGSLRKNLPVATATDSADSTMNHHALVTILEILAASLGQDNDMISSTRSKLGESCCTLLSDAGIQLGALVDSISYRNEGRKSRDFVIQQHEQRVMTALVQLIGNVCFRCHRNQERLRLTKVPPLKQRINAGSSSAEEEEERNALHVLLSCTSLAHSCFTLREWAVIAIRNVLDNNEHNQAEVAKLEANKPVQSAELASLGIRVDMDTKGNVSVVPNNKDGGNQNDA